MFDKSYDVSKQLPIIVITIKSIEPHDIRIKMTCNQNHNFFSFKLRVDNLLVRTRKTKLIDNLYRSVMFIHTFDDNVFRRYV